MSDATSGPPDCAGQDGWSKMEGRKWDGLDCGRSKGAGPGDALSCGCLKWGRLPSQQDGIRFHSTENSSQVYKSQSPPPLLCVCFFLSHFHCFVFLAATPTLLPSHSLPSSRLPFHVLYALE